MLTVKKIVWETNFNNKLGCNAFLHIDLAPVQKPTYRLLDNTLIEIETADGSYEPVKAKVYGILFISANRLPDSFALASHGIRAKELEDILNKTYGDIVVKQRGVAVYMYHKNLEPQYKGVLYD